jgi:assimilatory nitrate reductase catalytic subunit
MHWNDEFASGGCVNRAVNPATDPVSGEPEFKHTPVRIEPLRPAWHGFLLSRRRLAPDGASYWAVARGEGLWRYELAGDEAPPDWARAARALLCATDSEVEWIEYFDRASGRYRAARLVGGRLESCLFVGPDARLPSRDWLRGLFALERLDAATRAGLLAGVPPKGQADAGRQVCACFGVGEGAILGAIRSGCASVEALGQRLKAGSNCGSCVPELKALLVQAAEAGSGQVHLADQAVG